MPELLLVETLKRILHGNSPKSGLEETKQKDRSLQMDRQDERWKRDWLDTPTGLQFQQEIRQKIRHGSIVLIDDPRARRISAQNHEERTTQRRSTRAATNKRRVERRLPPRKDERQSARNQQNKHDQSSSTVLERQAVDRLSERLPCESARRQACGAARTPKACGATANEADLAASRRQGGWIPLAPRQDAPRRHD